MFGRNCCSAPKTTYAFALGSPIWQGFQDVTYIYWVPRMARRWPASFSMGAFQSQRSSAGSTKYIPREWALYPCKFDDNRAVGGAALDPGGGNELQPGRYVIRTQPPESAQVIVKLTTDVPRTRAYSVNRTHTPHNTNFVTRIRARDRRCCITGDVVVGEDYVGFEAAHIFPLSESDTWNNLNYKRFIEGDLIAPGFEMNSIQQGFLCSSTEHRSSAGFWPSQKESS